LNVVSTKIGDRLATPSLKQLFWLIELLFNCFGLFTGARKSDQGKNEHIFFSTRLHPRCIPPPSRPSCLCILVCVPSVAGLVSLEVNAEKTKYMLLSRHQNALQNDNIKISNRSFENVARFWERQ
jgi:hypothetical protein